MEPSHKIRYLVLCLLITQIILATIMSISVPFWLGYSSPYGTGNAPLTVIGVAMTVLALSTIGMAAAVRMPTCYKRFTIAVSLLVLAIALLGFLLWATQGIATSSALM